MMRGAIFFKDRLSRRFLSTGLALFAAGTIFSGIVSAQEKPALGLSAAVDDPSVLMSIDTLDAYRAALGESPQTAPAPTAKPSVPTPTAPVPKQNVQTAPAPVASAVSAHQSPPVPSVNLPQKVDLPVVTVIEPILPSDKTTVAFPETASVAPDIEASAPIPPDWSVQMSGDPSATAAANTQPATRPSDSPNGRTNAPSENYAVSPILPEFATRYAEEKLPPPPSDNSAGQTATSDKAESVAQTESAESVQPIAPVPEPDSLEAMQVALEAMRSEVDAMKKSLDKKQNKPDTSNKFSCKLGGMIFMDALTVDQSEENQAFYGDIDNQFMIRDLRLTAKGEGYGFLEYEATVGLNRDDINFKDVRLTAKDLPVFGDLTMGYFKVESSMGYVASIYDETFSEFDANSYAFRLARRLGIASAHYSADQSGRLFLGAFTGRDFEKYRATEEYDDAGIILNARATAVPIYNESCDGTLCEVWHVGASYYWDKPENDVNLRVRPTGWTYKMPYLLSGALPLADDSYSVAEFESAWQKGGFAVQGEGFFGFYEGYDNAYGLNAQARWMLTPGAYRTYNKNRGCFGDVFVPENLRFVDYGQMTCLEGPGAWEIACQWSYTDFDNLRAIAAQDDSVVYGTANEILVGVNWYWNWQTRLCFNWVHSMPNGATANIGSETRESDTFLAQMRVRF